MDEIDKMVQELIEYLAPLSDDRESLMIRAINVATIQLDYANYEVGVVEKQRRSNIMGESEQDLMTMAKLMRTLIAKKKYAKRLGLGLDRLVAMYQAW